MRDSGQLFVVRTGKGTVSGACNPSHPPQDFTDSLCLARRWPRQHSGWESVTYHGKRYQLFGGVHVYWFICLDHPLKRRPS